jgi:hypothetical protein
MIHADNHHYTDLQTAQYKELQWQNRTSLLSKDSLKEEILEERGY